MAPETNVDTPAAPGAIIRARRQGRGLSQQSLAEACGVSRKLVVVLEASQERAELGKTMAVFYTLGLNLTVPRGNDDDPVRRAYAETFTRLGLTVRFDPIRQPLRQPEPTHHPLSGRSNRMVDMKNRFS